LQKIDENESVVVRELESFAFAGLTGANLDKAIRQMEAIGYGKGSKRNLYHAILAPAYGETLNAAQQKFMVGYYAEHMGFQGHQYALVEHWKKGKQHFHLVFNIIHPATGKIHELKWSKLKEWKIARGLENIFGHATPTPKGKAAQTWEMQRSKRTGVDPIRMRKEVTRIYHASATSHDFIAALDKAGFALTYGQRGQLVLVDSMGDTHGLMRRIEGRTLADLRQKFSGIDRLQFPYHAALVKTRKAQKSGSSAAERETRDRSRVRDDVQRAYRTSTTGAAFFAKLNRYEYALGRGLKGFAVIDPHGERYDIDELLGKETAARLSEKFPDLAAIRPRPVSEIIRRMKAGKRRNIGKQVRRGRTALSSAPFVAQRALINGPSLTHVDHKAFSATFIKAAQHVTAHKDKTDFPVRVTPTSKGWPPQAVADWEAWGHRATARFFAKWPELAPEGFNPMGGPSL
jgi:hypothetical protein